MSSAAVVICALRVEREMAKLQIFFGQLQSGKMQSGYFAYACQNSFSLSHWDNKLCHEKTYLKAYGKLFTQHVHIWARLFKTNDVVN